MKKHQKLIGSADEIKKLAEALSKSRVIAYDTEFIRETSFFPKLEIMQVATDKESWLIDLQAFRKKGRSHDLEALAPLIEVLKDPDILKVVHAGQADQECLYHAFGMVAEPLIDTALAAALCGYGDGVGLANLLRSVLGVKIKKGHARTNWALRPLPPQQMEYAHQDVVHLVQLIDQLLAELDEHGRRAWALELSAQWNDTTQFDPRPDLIYMKLAKSGRVDPSGLNALFELITWRENRVRELNVPRRWVADDSVLLDVARVKPKDVKQLQSFRGLNKGEVKKSGEELVKLVKNAPAEPSDKLPKIERKKPVTARESRLQELLRCYLGMQADDHKIALRHLVTADDYVKLIRSGAKSSKDLVDQKILTQGAADLIGDEVVNFLKGNVALTAREGKVKVVSLD